MKTAWSGDFIHQVFRVFRFLCSESSSRISSVKKRCAKYERKRPFFEEERSTGLAEPHYSRATDGAGRRGLGVEHRDPAGTTGKRTAVSAGAPGDLCPHGSRGEALEIMVSPEEESLILVHR